MKKIIKKVLDRHTNSQANMASESFRDMLAVEIEVNLDKHFDLWTTKNTFPTGIDYELINTKSLSSSWPKMNIFEKEHLTLYFYENKSLYNFKINDFKPPLNWSKTQETFTVDTFQDYVKVLNIVDELGRIDFRIEDLLKSTNKKF